MRLFANGEGKTALGPLQISDGGCYRGETYALASTAVPANGQPRVRAVDKKMSDVPISTLIQQVGTFGIRTRSEAVQFSFISVRTLSAERMRFRISKVVRHVYGKSADYGWLTLFPERG